METLTISLPKTLHKHEDSFDPYWYYYLFFEVTLQTNGAILIDFDVLPTEKCRQFFYWKKNELRWIEVSVATI